jgi:alkylation response protein AidB-like acyl-CoA dehydrogenase
LYDSYLKEEEVSYDRAFGHVGCTQDVDISTSSGWASLVQVPERIDVPARPPSQAGVTMYPYSECGAFAEGATVISPPRHGFEETHELFREGYAAFLLKEVVPHAAAWEAAGIVDKALFAAAGRAGYVGIDAPQEYGGGGVQDFRYNAIMAEEAARLDVVSAVTGLSLHNDACLPYLLDAANAEQKRRWLPGVCEGKLLLAIAMTEPEAGSDLAGLRTVAQRDGDYYILNGSKTFISSAFNADLIIVACKTDPSERHRGISLLVVEADRPGFARGRKLNKLGQHAADTGELFFRDVRVPVANRLGAEGSGFAQMVAKLPRERLSIAMSAVPLAETAFQLGLEYAKNRHAFGQLIGTFQYNRFRLAEMRTEIDIARVFVDRLLDDLNNETLTPEAAAEAKWWTTELLGRVVDSSLQLHGGYGYMDEYPISRLYCDARVTRIYGGTTEIMKDLIGKALGV